MVAVVDDDEAVRTSLKFLLEIDGFAVRTYSTANAFLDSANLAAYSCVIVDQAMPEMTGLALVNELRRHGCRSPVLLIVSNPTTEVRQLAAEAGVPVIEKPLFGNALSEMLRRAIKVA